MRRLILVPLLAASACAGPPVPPIASPLSVKADYVCRTGEKLSLTRDPEEKTVSFMFEGRRIVLPEVTPAGDLFMYRDHGWVVRGDDMNLVFARNHYPDLVCARPPASPRTAPFVVANRVDFICAGGTRLEARFDPTNEVATLGWDGRTVILPQQPAASGFDYASAKHRLRGKGADATFSEGKTARACVTVEALGAPVDAFGQEPGWNAKLRGGAVEATLDYGKTKLSGPQVAPEIGSGGERIYRSGALTLALEGKDCADSMSGEAFPMTATLTTGGRTLKGCARPPAIRTAEPEAAAQ